MNAPVLWQFTASHFNEKARWALDWKRLPHVRRSLLPGPHAFKIRRMTGQTSVPVLVLDGRAIHDSTRIIEALERAFPDPPLYPRDETERRRALELEDFFDEELGPHIRRFAFHQILPHPEVMIAMFGQESSAAARAAMRLAFPLLRVGAKKAMRIDAEGAELSRRKTLAALDRIESEVGPSGYMVGDGFTVADLTAAALLSPLVAPPEFPYAPPPGAPQAILDFRESLAGRRAFQWVVETYRRHRGRSSAIPG
jgi:glutathione S-transferase